MTVAVGQSVIKFNDFFSWSRSYVQDALLNQFRRITPLESTCMLQLIFFFSFDFLYLAYWFEVEIGLSLIFETTIVTSEYGIVDAFPFVIVNILTFLSGEINHFYFCI